MDFLLKSIISIIIISGPGSAEINREFIHYQQYDSSCGFAALSTYLSCCWDFSIDEKDIMEEFFNFSEEIENKNEQNETTDQLQKSELDDADTDADADTLNGAVKQDNAEHRYAITFSDMKTILFEQGFAAMGFKQNFSELRSSLQKYGPVIMYENTEQGHFSVAVEILPYHGGGQVIILADPNTGIEYYSKDEFTSFWGGFSLLASPFEQNTHTYKPPIKLREKYEYFKTFTRAFYGSL